MKITDEAITCLPQNLHFSCWTRMMIAKIMDEWYAKEGRGKSMKNVLYVQRYGKRHLSGWSDIEQWKNQALILDIVELHKSEGIRQAVSQSVEILLNNFFYSLATFWKHLGSIWKLFWAYYYLTNAATSLFKEFWLVLRWIFFMVRPHNLRRPYYEPLSGFMILIS